MNDTPYVELRITMTHVGDRFAYQERIDPRFLFDRADLGGGPFAIPNRHNLRIALDRMRDHLVKHAHGDMTTRYGVSLNHVTDERRSFRLPYSFDWQADEGDALLNALVPQTGAETFVEAMQAANKARTRL